MFFSVLMLFLCVLAAKSCVFMTFLGKKIRPRRTWKGDCYAVSTERRGEQRNGDKEGRIRRGSGRGGEEGGRINVGMRVCKREPGV